MFEIPAVQLRPGETGEHEDPHPLVLEDQRAVLVVEGQQSRAQGDRAVAQAFGPIR